MTRTLEIVVEILDNIEKKPQWDNQHQIINPNYRKNNNPGKGKEPSPNQNIRPPFQENYAESSQNNVEDEEDINIVMGIDEENTIFLTQEDQELFELQHFKVESGESFDYKKGYDFAINEIHS